MKITQWKSFRENHSIKFMIMKTSIREVTKNKETNSLKPLSGGDHFIKRKKLCLRTQMILSRWNKLKPIYIKVMLIISHVKIELLLKYHKRRNKKLIKLVKWWEFQVTWPNLKLFKPQKKFSSSSFKHVKKHENNHQKINSILTHH